jgi:hypothetical protein
MRCIKIYQLPVVTAVAMAMSLLATSEVKAYTFTKIVDSNDGFFADFYPPAINGSGTVAFLANLDAGERGIFTSDGVTVTTIADSSGSFFSFGFPSINNTGTVAFGARLDAGGEGVYTGNGRVVTTIADTNSMFSKFGNVGNNFPTINNSGTVAFQAVLDDTEGQGVFTSNNGTLTTIADSSSSFSFLGHPIRYSYYPSINDTGAVAFGVFTGFNRGILLNTGGTITTIVDDKGFIKLTDSGVINNKGTVAFQANPNFYAFVDGVFTVSRGAITTIADDRSSPFNLFGDPAINDENTVVFTAEGAGFRGIFTGADPVINKVIATGDTLFGSRVTRVTSYNKAVNNLGQIAFYAELADGTNGIYRADPENIPPSKSVPEPTSLFGLLVGALGLVQRLKYKKRCKKVAL